MTDSQTRDPQPLSDEELLDGLRTANLPAGSFSHREHLRAGWLYLEHWPLPEALTRFSIDLQALAASHGAAEMFHTTVTWALLFALDERRRALGPGHTWDELAECSPELFDWKSFLGRYYSDAALWSRQARTSFLMPDRLALANLPADATFPPPGTTAEAPD